MLYCFSQSDYPLSTLENYFHSYLNKTALYYGKMGVLLALKYPQLFTQVKCNCYVLEQDIAARHLQKLIKAVLPTKCNLFLWLNLLN